MTALGTRFGRPLRGAGRPRAAMAQRRALAFAAFLSLSAPAQAQLFGDRPPPVPPAAVPLPEGVGTGAVSLAPPSGSGAPAFPPAALAPPMTAPPGPAAAAPPPAAASPPANQAVLALSARFGKDLPGVTGGIIWRVYADKPDNVGAFRML